MSFFFCIPVHGDNIPDSKDTFGPTLVVNGNAEWKCGRRHANVGPTLNRCNNGNYFSHKFY